MCDQYHNIDKSNASAVFFQYNDLFQREVLLGIYSSSTENTDLHNVQISADDTLQIPRMSATLPTNSVWY